MTKSEIIIKKTERYTAANYKPKPVVFQSANSALVSTPEGEIKYDMLSAYSAMNFGHCHPEIIAAAKEQLDKVTLTSRAFHNDQLDIFAEALCKITEKEMILPMNTGAEAVETALKAARRWGTIKKGVENGKQEIIVCNNNFHGRTITIISMSTDPSASDNYGPYTPGFIKIAYGDSQALSKAITDNTVAFLVEPIQGEAGIIMPPDGYLKDVRRICDDNNVLMIADEVQTGFARTGKMFACNWEDVVPDIYVLGKALGGGVMPLSAIAANREIMDVFEPGSHGSTFGGNPLACAVGTKALEILVRDNYPAMSLKKGERFMSALRAINNDDIIDIRGRGLLIGVEFKIPASNYVKTLIEAGILAKETHENTIRFAPPISIDDQILDKAIATISQALSK